MNTVYIIDNTATIKVTLTFETLFDKFATFLTASGIINLSNANVEFSCLHYILKLHIM